MTSSRKSKRSGTEKMTENKILVFWLIVMIAAAMAAAAAAQAPAGVSARRFVTIPLPLTEILKWQMK
jgi:hypothetical protein